MVDAGSHGRAKQNVFDDLYAVCEQLIPDGVARPDLLAFQGSSNGLVAAVAATERPDLFHAARRCRSISPQTGSRS
jgi:prolyl oligopeptidase PreP (S9A serine peptidase family)